MGCDASPTGRLFPEFPAFVRLRFGGLQVQRVRAHRRHMQASGCVFELGGSSFTGPSRVRSCEDNEHMLQTDRLAKAFERTVQSKGLFLSSSSSKGFISAVDPMTYQLQSICGAG